MNTQIISIEFNAQKLPTIQKDGVAYTAVKPICDNIGLDWTAQLQRLKRDEVLNSVMVMITTTGTDGKNYDMRCLPIEFLQGWLFGIDISRVKKSIRNTLIVYKKECYKALNDYWNNGVAIKKTPTPQKKKVAQDYHPYHSIIWELLNRHGNHGSILRREVAEADLLGEFGVRDLDDIPMSDIPEAIKHTLTNVLCFANRHADQEIKEYHLERIEKACQLIQSQQPHAPQLPPETMTAEMVEPSVMQNAKYHINMLKQQIIELGGQPHQSDLSKEQLINGYLTHLITDQNMMLSFGNDNQPNIKLIPKQSWVVNDGNIANIITDKGCGVSDETVKEIMMATAERLTR